MKKYCSLFFCIFFFSCASHDTANIIQPEAMKYLLWDLIRVGELVNGDTTSSVKLHLKDTATKKMQEILLLHHTDLPSLRRSLSFYESHPVKQLALYDSLATYATRQQDKLQKIKARKDSLNNKFNKNKLAIDSISPKDTISRHGINPQFRHQRDSILRVQKINPILKQRIQNKSIPKGYSISQPD